MKKRVTDFIMAHSAAFLAGIIAVVAILATKGMLDSVRSGIDEICDAVYTFDETIEDYYVVSDEEYVLKEYEGRIGVFHPGDTQPIKVEATYTEYLPEADRAALRYGITVYGWTEVEKLLYDFYS